MKLIRARNSALGRAIRKVLLSTMSSPWGVKLKSTGQGDNLKKGVDLVDTRGSRRRRLAEDANAERNIGDQRKGLRKVNLPPKTKRRSRSRSTSSSRRRYQKPGRRPFKLRKAPVFGVVLRPKLPTLGTIKEEEEYLDLEDLQLLQDGPCGENDAAARRPRRKNSLGSETDENESSIGSRRPIPPDEDDNENGGSRKTARRRSSKSSGIVVSFFGVRLKPSPRSRRRHSNSIKNRTYQIDLNPAKSLDNTELNPVADDESADNDDEYESQSKAFLELKLRPVSKGGNMMSSENDASNAKDSNQKFVELQLRHVVAPADGGPKRTVTEAVFQIPLLKKVAPKAERQRWRKDRLQDLLQIAVQNLNKAPPTETNSLDPQRLQIQLRHVDPDTQAVQTLEHAIDVALSHPDIVEAGKGDVPSMEVTLRDVEPPPTNRWSNAADRDASPSLSKVQIKHITTIEEDHEDDCNEESFSESSGDIDLMGEEFDSDTEEKLKKTSPSDERDGSMNSLGDINVDSSEDDASYGRQQVNMRASMPNLALEQNLPSAASDLQSVEEEEDIEEDIEKKDIGPRRPTRSDDKSALQRTRSSSLTAMDRMRLKAEAKRKEEKALKKKKKQDLSNQKRRDLLMWYNRMRTPTKDEMKRRVAALDKSCGISPADVDGLPWIYGGKFLDLRVMNQMFLNDWQGDKKENGDDSSSNDSDSG